MAISEQTRAGNPTHRLVLSESHENTDDVRHIEPDDEATISPIMNEDHTVPINDDDDCFDTNDRLIDELERILQGDFAPDDGSHTEIDAISEVGFPLTEPEPEPEPAFAVEEIEAVVDPYDWDDPEPTPEPGPAEDEMFREPPRSSFWAAAEPERARPGIAAEPREKSQVGRFTIAAVLLMIVAGGAYAFVQLSGEPVLPLNGETDIAAASPLGGGAPAFTADALAANPPETVVDETPAPEPEVFTPDPVAVTPEPAGEAVPTTIQPRIVQTVPVPDTTPPETAETPADDGLGGPLVEPEPTPAPEAAAPNAAPPANLAPTEPVEAPAGTTAATTTNWVNLRDGPDNDANVLLTVPAGATVDVVACDPWCEVYYEGTLGWIWQDYVDLP